jgi:hypothetical protein
MTTQLQRYAEAYLRMAKRARYRPTAKQLADPERLERKAIAYANSFNAEDTTNRAFIFTIEAARVLAGSWNVLGDEVAVRLLEMAIDEIKAQSKKVA